MEEEMTQLPIPPKRIYDPEFVYVKSAHTDIRQTFARIRAEMGEKQAQGKKVRRVK